jgi:hypothetical protein
MGIYINKGNNGFRISRNSEYVDKSGLIAVVNATLDTEQMFSCISRSRRFGKSMAAKMLAAYYDHSCDSHGLFADLEIAHDLSFEHHLNKYPVIYLDMTDFVSQYKDESIVTHIKEELKKDICDAYPDVTVEGSDDLMGCLLRIAATIGERFVFIIDEWDAICREFEPNSKAMEDYLDWMRRMFKSKNATDVFTCVYMTGILPIKKYKTQSAVNNFIEYSMVDPGDMAPYFGFTKNEVQKLADKYDVDFTELVKWYDGYQIGDVASMFNPNSVMQAIRRRRCRSYWGKTATFETVSDYIKMNFGGLKDDILLMLAGGRVKVNTTKFQNDMSIVQSKDDVLTVLIHLGYLSYDYHKDECYVPNHEVSEELLNAVEDTGWTNVICALKQSEDLLRATLDGDEKAVVQGIDAVHDENTSILSYNNENSLACVLSLAYYYAKNNYIILRELPSGKGFADIVMIPRKNVDSPAIIVELKYNNDTQTAISQIKARNYPKTVADYTGDILLVGINYDKNTKLHECKIEKWKKE